MKINYRLEVVYQVFEKKGKTFFETSNYVFNSKKSQQNRSDAINKYESFRHVFNLASKTTNYLKLSITEVINKNVSGFKIPVLNIYYSSNEFNFNNSGTVLFGDYLDEVGERLNSLEYEQKVYKKGKIKGFKTEIIKDYQGNSYKVLNRSSFEKEDYNKLNAIGA